VAIMLLGIVNFVPDADRARVIVETLKAAVPSGSFLVLSHPTREVNPDAVDRATAMWNEGGAAAVARKP
jgi:hypothetical protein